MFGLTHMLSLTTKNTTNKGNDGDIAVVQKTNYDNKSSNKKVDTTATILWMKKGGDNENMVSTEVLSISSVSQVGDGVTMPRSGVNGDKDENSAMDTSSTHIPKSGTIIVPDEGITTNKNSTKKLSSKSGKKHAMNNQGGESQI